MWQAYKAMWLRAFDFQGRSTRKEYFLASIASVIPIILLELFLLPVGIVASMFGEENEIVAFICVGIAIIFALIVIAYALLLLIPSTSLLVRRFHDAGKSGWVLLMCYFFSCCCGIGTIVMIVITFTPSQRGINQYGPNRYGL